MRWQIRTPSRALVQQSLCIFSGIVFGVQICSCKISWSSSTYQRTDNTRLTDFYSNLWKVTDTTCCSTCHFDSSCKSVTYNAGSQECRLSTVSFWNVGSNSETSDEWKTYSAPEPRGRDCSDIGRTGIFSSGVFDIFPVGVQGPVNVFCDFDDTDGPWTVIQRRVDGTVDFYRNYSQYQVGFGNLSGNFWLGLDKMSSITLQEGKQYCLKVTVVYLKRGKEIDEYSSFQVMDVTTGYILKVGGYTGNGGDKLRLNNGQPFSTYDRDMANDKVNCANILDSGWWFTSPNCGFSNLNGVYSLGIVWRIVNPNKSPTFASMKIKECI